MRSPRPTRVKFRWYWNILKIQAILFCSTGLPQARTRWVQSTFSSHWPLSSSQCHWWTSIDNFPLRNFWGCWESNPWQQGLEESMLPLCYAAPSSHSLQRTPFPVTSTRLLKYKAIQEKRTEPVTYQYLSHEAVVMGSPTKFEPALEFGTLPLAS